MVDDSFRESVKTTGYCLSVHSSTIFVISFIGRQRMGSTLLGAHIALKYRKKRMMLVKLLVGGDREWQQAIIVYQSFLVLFL